MIVESVICYTVSVVAMYALAYICFDTSKSTGSMIELKRFWAHRLLKRKKK